MKKAAPRAKSSPSAAKPSAVPADLKAELADHRRRDKALSLLLKSPSKKRRGWIFETAAQALAEGLGYRWAVAAEILDDGRRAEARAFWSDRGFREPFTFDPSGTPYAEILKKRGYGLFRDGIKDLFPADGCLAEIDAVSYQAAIFFDNARRPVGLVIAANDVVERRKVGSLRDFLRLVTNWVGTEVERRAAEKALGKSERTYRALYDNVMVGLGRSAVNDGRLVDANDRLAEMFGYKNAEEAIAEFVAADHYVDPAARTAMIRQLEKTGEVRDFEVAFTRKGGEIVWVRCFMRLAPEGDYIDFVGADVTERRRREREAADQSELFNAAFNNMAQGMIVFDGEKRILAANSRAAELIEVPARMLARGADFLEVVRFAAERGDYGPGKTDKILRDVIAKTDETTVIQLNRTLPNGKVLQIQAAPRPGGGQVVTYADVTEHRRREAEMAENSALLGAALENMEQGLVVFDGKQKIVAANARAAELLDAPADMLAPGADFLAFIRHTVERGDFGEGNPAELMVKPIAAARSRSAERVERTLPNGRVLVGQTNPRPGGGKVVTYSDITELKRKEEEVAAQAQLLSAMFDNMAQGMLMTDADLTILASNQKAARLIDVSPQMLAPGENFGTVIRHSAERGDYGPGDIDELYAKYASMAKKLPGGEMQLEHILPNGTVVEVRGVAMPGGGNVFTHTDITERKRAAHEIEDQSTLLAGTLENMAQGLVALDGDLNILASNSHAADLLDIPPDMIQPGADFGRFIRFAAERGDFGDGDVDEIAAKQIAVAKKSLGEQFERRLPNGRTVEVRTTVIPGGGAIATYSDVTDRKRGEERLKQLNAQLQTNAENLKRSNAELEQFAYVASHDLQEPLRMVSSYCQLLQSRYADGLDEDANEFINFAVDGADRMKGLIQDLLAYSRVGSRDKELEPTDLAEVCDVVLHNLGMAIEDSRATITHDALPTVAGDRTQLVQLFQNLIGNAIKFRAEKTPEIHIGAEQKDGEWLLSVRDNGTGIEPEYKDRIFVIFQRLHGAHEFEGTGIGLAVCKKIVERHGGNIWVESQPGEGSAFHFTLPAKGANT